MWPLGLADAPAHLQSPVEPVSLLPSLSQLHRSVPAGIPLLQLRLEFAVGGLCSQQLLLQGPGMPLSLLQPVLVAPRLLLQHLCTRREQLSVAPRSLSWLVVLLSA